MFILLFIGIGGVIAADTSDIYYNDTSIDENLLTVNNIEDNLNEEISQNVNQQMKSSEKLSSPKTVTVTPDASVPNQLLKPTVQEAIDNANPGDTLILKGNFVQCGFVVNKQLTIKADSIKTTVDPCPDNNNPAGTNYFGIFYISPQASGTVIEGFNFINENYIFANRIHNPYAVFVDGADNVTIKDCTINWNLNETYLYEGIIVKDSKNSFLTNVYLNNTKRGITIHNSQEILISDSKIENGRGNGINVNGFSKNIWIKNNEILNNQYAGINLSSADSIHILNNVIEDNARFDGECGSGVYINCNVSGSEIKGNLMMRNGLHAILLDHRLKNMGTSSGDDNLLLIENNYFDGHKDMVVHRRIFEANDYGSYNYDEVNDIYYRQVGGPYLPAKAIFYMKSAYVAHDIVCGFTYYAPKTPWSEENYIHASISQIENGVYNLSLKDGKGNLAVDLSSVDVVFYLNNMSGISKTIRIQNGSAVADFTDCLDSYLKTGNVILAALPTEDPVSFIVNDSDILSNEISTKLIAYQLTTYPLSDSYFKVKLTDIDGKALASKVISFKINGKIYSAKTDNNGIVKIKVSLTAKKTYEAAVSYNGDESYAASQTSGKIIVKTGTKKSKITASNIKVKRDSKKTFSFKLTSGDGKALKSQKVVVKVNGKSYTLKTSSKGIAKLSVKLSKVKKYGVSIKFLGNANYKAASKIAYITVTK